MTSTEAHDLEMKDGAEVFRTAFLTAGIGIAVADAEGRLLDANPALAALLDDAPEHLVGRTFQEFTHPEDLEIELPLFQRVIAGETDRYQLDKRYRRRNGSHFWGRTTVACVRDAGGAVVRFIGEAEDITAIREAEEARTAAEARFRALVERSTDIMAIADADGTVRWVSPAATDLLGKSPHELEGTAVFDLLPVEDRADAEANFAALRANPGMVTRRERRMTLADGSVRWLEVTSTSHLDNPAVAGIVLNVRDITVRKEAEAAVAEALAMQRRANAELVELGQQRAEFLAMLAHDFRSPLTAIVGYAELLGMETKDERQREDLRAIVAAADRLTGLVSDMLAAETMDERHARLDCRPADLGELVGQAVEEQRASWPGREIALEIEPGLPAAVIDRAEVSRAVTNLLTNALKYSPDGEPVAVAVRRHGDSPGNGAGDAAEIAVRDHGIGIPADRLERIFQPYERIRSERTSGILGVGLGLPIVRAVARSHGGDAWAESVEGGGSTFRLRLPFAPAAA